MREDATRRARLIAGRPPAWAIGWKVACIALIVLYVPNTISSSLKYPVTKIKNVK